MSLDTQKSGKKTKAGLGWLKRKFSNCSQSQLKMKKYTQEELIVLREHAVVPTEVDFAQFTQDIEEQRTQQATQDEHHDGQGRRRSSHHIVRPVFKPRKPKATPPQPDADGWVTMTTKKNSVSGEEATESRDQFRESAKDKSSTGFVRPNNKNIGSSKPADARDITADKPKSKFNAFAALGSDDDETESEEDDE